ncbi:M16 family metallopeptidase [Belliella kenyensis]|uniref:M16 family metallopeptidase n=1 Tax=Belliella kenyensis TaxID=1472724 RepID=A0ABV8EL53_9BACT|nr:pitrilysin family protein [Belliella kenyensis]MCH7400639.1 insulinase family protein [Belliella kenyensis]MDN3602074.1 pitrilysin family protein [Belliella kenyensis]
MTLDRSKAPDFQIPQEINLPSPIKRTLANGVHLYFMPTPEIDACRLEICTEAQRSTFENEKKLTSFFTLHMMMEGTEGMSASEIDDFFDFFASEVDVTPGFEHNSIALLTTKKHFGKVFPIFASLLTDATFPEKELAKRKSQKALNISIQKEKTSVSASQLFRQQLFGADHPFGQIADENDVEDVQRDDLIKYYKESLLVNPEIFVTGNLDAFEMDLITETLGKIPVSFIPQETEKFENKPQERQYELREDALQSSLRIGFHLVPKTHVDYLPITIFNTILGGYFGSRLIKNIREDKGHTYGIYSTIGSLKQSDYWVIMADVQKSFVHDVIEEIYKEIDILKSESVPEEEVELVRNYMIGNFLSTFSSPFELINKFKAVHQSGLSMDFYAKKLAYIREFSAKDIKRVAQKYFDTKALIEVIVG